MKMDEGEDEPEIVLLGPSQFMTQNFITSFPDLSFSISLTKTHRKRREENDNYQTDGFLGFKA